MNGTRILQKSNCKKLGVLKNQVWKNCIDLNNPAEKNAGLLVLNWFKLVYLSDRPVGLQFWSSETAQKHTFHGTFQTKNLEIWLEVTRTGSTLVRSQIRSRSFWALPLCTRSRFRATSSSPSLKKSVVTLSTCVWRCACVTTEQMVGSRVKVSKETTSLCKKLNIIYNIITCNPEPTSWLAWGWVN